MKNNTPPMRRCIGCMESKPKKELTRIAFYEGNLTLDLTGRAKGRGAYICKNGQCLETAIKRKAFSRAFKSEIKNSDLEEIRKELDGQ